MQKRPPPIHANGSIVFAATWVLFLRRGSEEISPAIFLFGGRNEPSVADAKNFGIYRKFSVLSEIKPFTGNKFFD